MSARLRHPSSPRVSEHFVILDDGQYLIVDYTEGEDLGQMVEGAGPLDEARALAWIEKVCNALTYLHRWGPAVIHRDVEPNGIKITPNSEVFLVEFGIAIMEELRAKTTTGALGIPPDLSSRDQYGTGGTAVVVNVATSMRWGPHRILF